MTAETTKTPKIVDLKSYQARLKTQYNNSFAKELKDELKLHNVHEVPRLQRIVVNIGLGKATTDKKILEIAENTLTKITGQKPVATISKKSIASFKLREGSKIGLKVTLNGNQMYEFADRLINLVLARLRDFHGVSLNSFDKQGNYSLGLVEQSVFPELNFEDITTPHGLQVVFVIKSRDPEHSKALLQKFGMPFEKPIKSDNKQEK